MKRIGIIKEIDSFGRLTLPEDLCKQLNIKCNSRVQITATKDGVLIERYVEPVPMLEQLRKISRRVDALDYPLDITIEIKKRLIELAKLIS